MIFLPSNDDCRRLGGGNYRDSRLELPSDPEELAYIAGLFDGEGCITRTNGRPIAQVGMTHAGVIGYLAEIGGTVRVEDGPNRGNRKPLYRWRVLAGREVAEFLSAIFPYLRVKRAEAEEAIVEIWGLLLRLADEA